uniref:Odorant Binding Protein n=1 Tax=Epiphyas postvittana TaxID=65032 RepID=A0A0K8TUW2_EPIPO
MAQIRVLILVAVVCAVMKKSHAVTEEEHKEMHELMMPIVVECSEQHGSKPDDIIAVKESKDVDGMDSCLIDCVFKKIGIMNDDGMFVVEKFTENMNKIMKKDGDSAKIDDLAKHCASVNDKDSDDKCGRSKALLACLMEQKDALGL